MTYQMQIYISVTQNTGIKVLFWKNCCIQAWNKCVFNLTLAQVTWSSVMMQDRHYKIEMNFLASRLIGLGVSLKGSLLSLAGSEKKSGKGWSKMENCLGQEKQLTNISPHYRWKINCGKDVQKTCCSWSHIGKKHLEKVFQFLPPLH